jgi:solute carrier family 10 (sodium/bile acid cotransporter), member 7
MSNRSRAKQLPREWFVPALVGAVLTATLFPCRGIGVRACDGLAVFAISSLFFLQGARLSRQSISAGIGNWRLHLGIGGTTFVIFPLLGCTLLALFPTALTPSLRVGLLFVCVLPSTVQSSIALTSIAGGEVSGAISAAAASNVIGVFLSPLLLALLLRMRGGGTDLGGLWKILVELLLPFIAGHTLRPWIGQWADRNRAILAITDRGSILIVVYIAFSAAVVNGIWVRLSLPVLAELLVFDALLLVGALVMIKLGSLLLGMPRGAEVAMMFCGSQKSVVTGVPMAQLLFAAPVAGMIVLPIMLYHLLQLLVGAWLARRYAAGLIGGQSQSAIPFAVASDTSRLEPARARDQ